MRNPVLASLALFAIAATPALADDMFANVQTVSASGGNGDVIYFDALSSDVMTMDVGESITLNFGPSYEARLDRLETQSMGAQVWSGLIEGGALTDRVLISDLNGITFGRIIADGQEWNILPAAGGGHQIIRHPDNAIQVEWGEDGVVPSADQLITNHGAYSDLQAAADVPVGSNGNIDILVVYTSSMADTWGVALGGRVQYLVALLDQALIDSDSGLRARLVGLTSASASETASNLDTLYDLQDGAGSGLPSDNNPEGAGQDFSGLLAQRDALGADLVALIRRHYSGTGAVNREGSSCGIAFVNGSSSDTITPANAPTGVSVVSDWINGNDLDLTNGYSFCSDTTFAHEIGHNLGLAHNREDTTAGSGVRSFAHGHRVDCEFTTIMSYSSNGDVTCPGTGRNELSVSLFSNPDLNTCPEGAACGIPAADADSADNARALREEGLNVSAFRSEVPNVVSAVLPTTRSVQNGTVASAFATVINPEGAGTATGCGLRLAGSDASTFSYQTTDSANALTGTANTPVDIPAGNAQTFVFGVTSASSFTDNTTSSPQTVPTAFDERNLFIEAFCENRRSSQRIVGLNTLTFTSTPDTTADIVALSATVNSDGYVDVPLEGDLPTGFFSVAIANVGADGVITVSVDTGGQGLALDRVSFCQTDSAGECQTIQTSSLTLLINNGETATFAVFALGNGGAIADDPALNRIFVRFSQGTAQRGGTSVAVRTVSAE